MIRGILLVILLLIVFQSQGQVLWMVAQDSFGRTVLHHKKGDLQIGPPSGKQSLLNYHPTYKVEAPLNWPLTEVDLSKCQMFLVYQPDPDSREQIILSFAEAQSDQLIFTDRRIADLRKGKFMNFIDVDLDAPRLTTYQHAVDDLDLEVLRLGQLPINPEIPVAPFRGSIAELILFDGVLAPLSKQKLETALAIKYSIPLAAEVDYVAVDGTTILDYSEVKDYKHRLAGLGRADGLELYQKQSQSRMGEGMLAIGLDSLYHRNEENPALLTEGAYLLWADNNEPLDFEQRPHHPPVLMRKWQFFNHRMENTRPVKVRLQHRGIKETLKAEEYLWLAVDPKETGGYSGYYRLTATSSGFESATIDLPIRNKNTFTFIKAPGFWLNVELQKPSCGDEFSGFIHLNPIGGTAPYQFEIRGGEDNNLLWATDSREGVMVEELRPGSYHLKATDVEGNSWQEKLYLNPSEIELPDLKTKYFPDAGDPAVILLPENSGYHYEWIRPDQSQQQGTEIQLDQSGKYTLFATKEGCRAIQNFEVLRPSNVITGFSILPNPTVNYRFTLRATLEHRLPYRVKITSIDGKVITESFFPAARFIDYSGRLPNTGTFILTLIAGQSSRSERIIAVNP